MVPSSHIISSHHPNQFLAISTVFPQLCEFTLHTFSRSQVCLSAHGQHNTQANTFPWLRFTAWHAHSPMERMCAWLFSPHLLFIPAIVHTCCAYTPLSTPAAVCV